MYISDNDRADAAMMTASVIRMAPHELRDLAERAYTRSLMMVDKATSAATVNFQRLPVQSSHMHDLSDDIADIDTLRRMANEYYTIHAWALEDLRRYCRLAGFSRKQTDVWAMRYDTCSSLGNIANVFRLTKSQVQYMLDRRAESKFALAILNDMMPNVDAIDYSCFDYTDLEA